MALCASAEAKQPLPKSAALVEIQSGVAEAQNVLSVIAITARAVVGRPVLSHDPAVSGKLVASWS